MTALEEYQYTIWLSLNDCYGPDSASWTIQPRSGHTVWRLCGAVSTGRCNIYSLTKEKEDVENETTTQDLLHRR
ncbi:MAG: hypothetical protein OQL06_00910, partial [Gammaproteobacteria bacterium]|nr:hypothetical protein [Gammaproteobacteria bacterium]